ncbi:MULTISPECIES: hypothetical protein [Caballeronia]|uniref:Lipoprotein n=1 Tax=Caballeronia zhejiangensis TaxID=871203 RepID=A0A656QI20_9BURK|nr:MULTISPECIES: hypothetical protein [Caballeronia]EKS69419.1 hypothetical protein BURK_015115 [Burkholderia sp. SJ98]KDR29711.1 hypothetical protein BG60_06470 [Caballeronia zhejiangensis]MDR5791100.1 hypothetical protein [Caballeronia sp. LP003]
MTRNAIPFVVCAIALAACSTGGSNSAPPPGAVTTTLPSGGVYKGSLTGSTAQATLLMLFDGTAYLFYASAGGAGLAGVAVAKSGKQSGDGRFISDAAFDYRVGKAPASAAVFSVNFARAPAVDGTVANKDDGAGLAFSANAAPMLDIAPSRANAGGLYSGRGMSLGGTTQTRITVAGDGYLAGTTTSGCIFKGTTAPHQGANAYDVSVTFGPAPCPLPETTVTGHAVLDGARLLVALPSPDRTDVFLFDGRK